MNMKIRFLIFLILIAAPAINRPTAAQTVRPDEIIEIILETGDGFCADCARITSLNRDGAAIYHGGKNSRIRKGDFSGKINSADFKKLAKTIVEAGFFGLKSRYEGKTSDAATTKFIVKYSGGRVKTVENFGASDNPKLKIVERAFDTAAGKVIWQADESEK